MLHRSINLSVTTIILLIQALDLKYADDEKF